MVEEGAGAAVGGDDGELTAPHRDRFGDTVEKTLVGMEREFVESDVAAFSGESIRVGGKGIDSPTVGELQNVSGGAGVFVEEHFAQLGGTKVEEPGPIEAVFEL